MTNLIVDWLVVYAVHSTLLLGAVYCLERCRLLVELDVRESAWRVALFGALLSASLHIGLKEKSNEPDTARRAVPQAVQTPSAAVNLHSSAPQVNSVEVVARDKQSASSSVSQLIPHELPLQVNVPVDAVAVIWSVAGFASFAALLWQVSLLRSRFARARHCTHPTLIAEVKSFAARGGVRIVDIREFEAASPLVIPPATLCIPRWMLTGLTAPQRQAMIAHEVAHLVRRDPWWRLVYRACVRLMFFQPLNRLAVRRLDEIAELRCDEWAALATDRYALAECLIECGERVAGPRPSLLATAMANSRSSLVSRVQTLLAQSKRVSARVIAARSAMLLTIFGVLALPIVVLESPAHAAEEGKVNWSVREVHGNGIQFQKRSSWLGLGPELTTIKIIVPGATLGARIEGTIKFSPAEDAVSDLSGTAVIEEHKGSDVSRVEVTKDGSVRHRYTVNDQSRPFESEGRQFLSRILPVLLRESTLNADERIKRIAAAGGPDAVLNETALTIHGFSRRVYIALLAKHSRLSDAQLSRALTLTDAINSDFERRVALSTLLEEQTFNDAQVSQFIVGLKTMHTDFEQRLLLESLLRKPGVADRHAAEVLAVVAQMGSDFEERVVLAHVKAGSDPTVIAAWGQVLAAIDSDFELRVVITRLAREPNLSPAMLEVLLNAVNKIETDFEARSTLEALAPHVIAAPALIPNYAAASKSIANDFEQRVALMRLIKSAPLDVTNFKSLLAAVESIGSEFECGQVLDVLLSKLPTDAESIDLYKRAVARCRGGLRST